jgi:hypothetical protein
MPCTDVPSGNVPAVEAAMRRLGGLAAALVLAGCASAPDAVRSATYPPGFHYLTAAKLETAMGRLARDATALNALLRREGDPAEAERAEVVRLLAQMEATTGTLDVDGATSNHPMLSRHLASFRRDLERAQRAAEAKPPNYFLAGSVTGACLACHETSE